MPSSCNNMTLGWQPERHRGHLESPPCRSGADSVVIGLASGGTMLHLNPGMLYGVYSWLDAPVINSPIPRT